MAVVVALAFVAFRGRGVTRQEATRIAAEYLLREHPEIGRSVEVTGEFHDNQGGWTVFFRGEPPASPAYSVMVSRDGTVLGTEGAGNPAETGRDAED
jgi:hypothetical protein